MRIFGILLLANFIIGFFLGGTSAYAWSDEAPRYVVRDTFVGRCPTWAEIIGEEHAIYIFNVDPDATADSCSCIQSRPIICRSNAEVDQCAPTVKECECVENCDTGGGGCTTLACDACTDTGWVAYATGYEVRTSGGTCSGNSCTSHGVCSGQTTLYRCAAGYWGKPVNGTSGCTKCTDNGVSVAGATVQTQCYIPMNTEKSDGMGTYIFTTDCYYN